MTFQQHSLGCLTFHARSAIYQTTSSYEFAGCLGFAASEATNPRRQCTALLYFDALLMYGSDAGEMRLGICTDL